MNDSQLKVIVDAQTRGFVRGMDQVTRKLGVLRKDHLATAATGKVLERQMRDLTRELNRQSRSLGLLTLQYVAFRRALLTTAVRTAVTGFTALTASVAALGSAFVLTTASLTKFVGALGTVGVSGLLALAQGATVASLALDGIGKAITSSGKDYERAMSKLTKPAKGFVREVRDLQTAFREIKLLAQEGLFTGLEKAVRHATPLLKPFKQVVYDTAVALGYLADQAAKMAASRAGDLKALGERNVITMRRFGTAATNMTEGFIDVLRAADPLIGHITAGIVTFSEKLRDAAAEARANGGLGSFFFELRKSWDAWTDILGNVARTLFGVFKAAQGPSEALTKSIDRVTERWAKFTNSVAGQRKMTAFFESSNRVLGSMAGFAGDLAKTLGRLSMAGEGNAIKFFDMLRTKLLPVLEELALSFNEHVFPAFLDLTAAVLDFAKSVAPGLEKVSQIFADFLGLVARLVRTFRDLTAGLPDVTRMLAGLVIGAGLIAGWGKLGLAIKLAVYELRRFLGLAPEIAGARAAGATMLFNRGGRNQGLEGGQGGGSGIGVVGGRRVAPGGGPQYVRPSGGGFTARTVNTIRGLAQDATVGAGMLGTRTYVPGRPGFRDPASGRFAPSLRPQPPYYYDSKLYQHRGAGGRIIAPPAAPIVGARTQAYRDATSIEPGKRGMGTRIANEIAGGTKAGLTKGMQLAKPVLKGGFAFAAINGVISGLSSGSKDFRGRLTDTLSGATFGLLPSSSDGMNDREKRLGRVLETGNKAEGIEGLDKGEFKKFSQHHDARLTSADIPRFREELKKLRDSQKITAEGFAALDAAAVKFGNSLAKAGGNLKLAQAGLDLGGKDAQIVDSAERIKRAFDELGKTKGLKNIREEAALSASVIKSELGTKSEDARLALSKNFRLAAAAVKRSMDEGVISTKTGTAEIRRLMISAIDEILPGGRKQAGRYLHDRDPLTGKPISGPSTGAGAARGALHRLSGHGLQDSIPLNVNGKQVVAAPGEDVAIFNRHQRAYLDRRLADVGGLPGVFNKVDKPHYAAGGFYDRASHGGQTYPMVTGDTDFRADLGRALSAMAKSTGTPIFVQEGGRTIAEQQARYNTYLGGGNLAAKPGPNAPHVAGRAADITPGRSRFGAVAGKFGLGFTVPSEAWHIELIGALRSGDYAGAAQIASAATGQAVTVPKLKSVTSGMGGLLGDLVDASLSRVRGAAQSRVDSAGGGSSGSVGGSGSGRALMESISRECGWNFADWWEVDRRETGHGSNLVNPTSTARLRGQFLDMNWGKFGPGSDPGANPSMDEQIRSMAAYIASRYGNPTRALQHHNANNWYARGGLIPAAEGLPPRNQGTPTVNTDDAVTGRGGPAKKGKAKKKPFTGGPKFSLDAIKKVQGKARKIKTGKQQEWVSKYAKFDISDEDAIPLGLLPDFAGRFDIPIETIQNKIAEMSGIFGLTDGTPDQEIAEIRHLLGLHTGTGDGSGHGGLLGLLEGYLGAVVGEGIPKVGASKINAERTLEELRLSWEFEHANREAMNTKVRKLSNFGYTYQERLGDNDARIEYIDGFLNKIPEATAGHRRTEALTKKIAKARRIKKELQAENKKLLTDKPGPKHTPPKNETAKQKAKRLADNHDRTLAIRGGTASRNESLKEMTFLAGDREKWNPRGGIAGDWTNRISSLGDALTESGASARQLSQVALPAERLEIATLLKAIGEQSKAPNADAMNALLTQQNEQLSAQLLAANQQGSVFAGFGPLLGARLVGAFEHGTAKISETGLALVHKNETITPAPDGPFYNQAAARQRGGDGGSVELHFAGDLAPLIRLVDARIEKTAARVVTRQLGRKAKTLSVSPGG